MTFGIFYEKRSMELYNACDFSLITSVSLTSSGAYTTEEYNVLDLGGRIIYL